MDELILQIRSSLCTTTCEVTNTVIIVHNIIWSYKYCHHCAQHHMKLQIPSSLCTTSYEVTNTVIIVHNIIWSYKYRHHCAQHHMKLQIPSSLCTTSYEVTNTKKKPITLYWFSPGTPISSTNKTDRHYVAKILLKVASNTIKLPQLHVWLIYLQIC